MPDPIRPLGWATWTIVLVVVVLLALLGVVLYLAE